MIGIIIIAILTSIFVMFITAESQAKNEANGIHTNGIPKCPPHKWTYKEVKNEISGELESRMICDKCTRFPGQY